ncbi:hypothetical protein P879_02403 [Paragonimus westermani]|uniref:General transcription factor IIH subunit n=1 Tax=Paragonimus westermani TaxID=34504 RepID=A0A8T0DT88_9TREM|nr:hypothetical protein P879_02403 [Paragonimus westermani]
MMRREEKHEFLWESGYEKTWSSIKEDDAGRLVTTLEQLIHDAHAKLRRKRRRLSAESDGFLRLGMMRHLFLIIDLSQAMHIQDLKPNRLVCTLRAATTFIRDYFDQNPISQLGIIVTMDRRAERLTELSGNPRCHLVALESLYSRTCEGEPSLQNALMLAESRLKYVPHHSEIVALMANLTTCDPGDIHQTIQSLVSNRIRCSVISLAVEVFVYRALAQLTKGVFHVILDETHLKTVLKDFVPPPVAAVESDATLIRMGFPHSETFDLDCFFTKRCICHLHSQPSNSNDVGPSINPRPQYACPRCRAAYCELPIECSVCGLTLAAAPHLARAYHHLFPLDTFDVITSSDPQNKTIETGEPLSCSGCDCLLSTHLPKYQCKKCEGLFCSACDAFLHDSVHSCPSCVSKSTLQI